MTEPRIVTLHRDTPESWALMPQVLARVRLFAAKYDADTSAEVLCEFIRQHFILPDEKCRVRVLAAVRDGEVVGHLVVSVDPWCGRYLAHLVQYEIDKGARVPAALLRHAHEQAMCWAETLKDADGHPCGAQTSRVLALGDARGQARVRAFRRYGYTVKKIVMDRALHPSEETKG